MSDELKEIGEQAASLHAQVVRLRDELAAVQAEEHALLDRLATLGAVIENRQQDEEDSRTTIDRIEAGLPGQRRPRLHPTTHPSTLRAGATGAGLALGLAIIVLLAIDLGGRGSSPPPASMAMATATTSGGMIPSPPLVITKDIPSSPPATTSTDEPVASVAPTSASSQVPGSTTAAIAPAKPSVPPPLPDAPGALTVICTPKCDAITDNNVPLAPGSTVNVASGPHKLVLSARGSQKTMLVNVTPGQTREVRVAMEQPSPALRDYGF